MGAEGFTETAQYLTFVLDGELFALNIEKVREVLEFAGATRVPRTPEFLRGVINLRGSVVPVVDLRVKFGLAQGETTVNTCVIIVEAAVDGEGTVLGALADSVQEVVDLEPAQIDPPPKLGTRLDTAFISGMGKKDGRFLLLLDIDRVFTTEELALPTDGSQ